MGMFSLAPGPMFRLKLPLTRSPWGEGGAPGEEKQKLPRFPNSVSESPGSIRGWTDRGPSGGLVPSHGSWTGPSLGQIHSPPLHSSYRFKSSPFKELISDLSSLIFWDSKIQLVDVVA